MFQRLSRLLLTVPSVASQPTGNYQVTAVEIGDENKTKKLLVKVLMYVVKLLVSVWSGKLKLSVVNKRVL